MSVRSRPRNGAVKDDAEAHEEFQMWNQIKKDLEKLSGIQKRQIEVSEKIKKKEGDNKELENSKSEPFLSFFFLHSARSLKIST